MVQYKQLNAECNIMKEAEKTDTLPATETPAASLAESRRASQPEANMPEDIFDQLGALTNSDEFDLRGIIKRARSIDKQVKEEMLGLIDEAQGKLVVFKAEGANGELAAEAAAYFDILMEMAEKKIPNFEKKLTEHNKIMEAKRVKPEEGQPAGPAKKSNDSDRAEQNEGLRKINSEDEGAEEKSFLANDKKMKKESSSGARTLQEGLAALADSGKLDRVIAPNKSADSQVKEQKIADKTGEAGEERITAKAGESSVAKVADNLLEEETSKQEKKKPIKEIGSGNGEKPPSGESAEKIAEIEKKMAEAYRNFFDKKIESQDRRKITDPLGKQLFGLYKTEYPGETKKDLWVRVDELRNSVHNGILDQVREKRAQEKLRHEELLKREKENKVEREKTGPEDRNKKTGEGKIMKSENRQNQKESLTQRLNEVTHNIYGYINDKKDVPAELNKLKKEIQTELWGVIKDRNKVGEITEKIKNKYRENTDKKLPGGEKEVKTEAERMREMARLGA